MTAKDSLDHDGEASSPLLTENPREWDDLVESIHPPSILIVIETRMSAGLKRRISAEDIWQETLLHIWRDREKCRWQGLRRFRAWVLKIAENRIRDAAAHVGAAKRGGGTTDLPLGASATGTQGTTARPLAGPAGSTTPSRVAVYREQAEAMKAALAALPEDVREVVRLRLWEQMGIAAIGERLGLGESAVRHRFRKGAELYRQRLLTAFASRSTAESEKS